MKKLMWGLAFLPLIVNAFIIQKLPETIPMHYDLAGNIDRWGSRSETFIFPGLILLMTLFWFLLIKYFEKKAGSADPKGKAGTAGSFGPAITEKERSDAAANAKVLGWVSVATTLVFIVMYGATVLSSYREAAAGATVADINTAKLSVLCIGVLLIVLGGVMTKTKINGAVGVRTDWSMYNENTWEKSNRYGAAVMMITGAVVIVTAALTKALTAAIILISVLLADAAIITVKSKKIYDEEILRECKARNENNWG